MDETHRGLLELQELDQQIRELESRIAAFTPRLDSLEAPVTAQEREVEAARGRLSDMKTSVRKLERAEEEKRDRLKRYQERLERVRNAREEAAARTEMDLVRRAADADEEEALQLMEQTKSMELKLDDMEKQAVKARSEVEPQRQALVDERAELEREMAVLRDRRENQAIRVPKQARQVYERVRAGRTRTALARLMPDGACGHCFNIVPIQEQSVIRRGGAIHRCEACGVILYTED